MQSNSALNHIDSPGQTSEKTVVARGSRTAQAILNNANSSHIHHNTIVTNIKAEPSLKVLHKRVAPNAILNAGGRADEVRCHPGTRKEVIHRIEEWRKAQGAKTPPVFWLSGPAGAGKSAIVQTVAESYNAQGIPQANFFFFREDTSRSHNAPLIPTLVYQIISESLYPSLRDPIAALLSADPVILDSRLEDQLRQLIVNPLCAIQRSSPVYQPLLILIDGLDECDSTTKDSQERILLAFDRVLEGFKPRDPPFCLLVASRDESQIQRAFNMISSQCRNIYLDEEFSPEDDIRIFVEAQFTKVRKTHGLAHTLDAAWPSADDIEGIVKKSSGHYIYAATVMRFILRSSASPIISLERVQGAARLATTKSPLSHLDAIYTYILSQVEDQDALKDILHVHSCMTQVQAITPMELKIGNKVLIMDILACFNRKYSRAAVLSCLADLTPIARYATESQELLFYHASFSDYLFNESRSRDYFVNSSTFDYKIIPVIWQFIRDTNPRSEWLQFGLCGITLLKNLPPSLMRLVSETPCHWRNWGMKGTIFPTIYNLCTRNDDIKYFRSIFAEWINNSRELDQSHLNSIKDIPFSTLHYQMARARRGDALDPASLRPQTDLDRNDVSVWLKDLLRSRHKLIEERDYKRLLRTWIPWAIENSIPLNHIQDIPLGRKYYQMARAERGSPLDTEMAAILSPETDLDRADLSVWLQDLLSHRHQSVKQHVPNQLLKTWIPWAIENNIPLNVKHIPLGRMYYHTARVERGCPLDFEMTASLSPETDLDRAILSVWLSDFLGSYSIEKRDYKRLLKTWIAWGLENKISLNGIKHIPLGPMYYQMARAERGYPLDTEMAAGLRPETDLDRADLSAWLQDFVSSRRQFIKNQEYKQLMKAWIPWAVVNGIPLGVLNNLPDVGQYKLQGKIKKFVGWGVSFKGGNRKK